MYGIFMECYVALRQYFGGESAGDIRAYLNMIVFFASAIFIMIKEKDKVKKILFGIMPLVIIVGFLLPITRIIYVGHVDKDSPETYYRILWLIPMYIVIAYAACLIIMKMKSDAIRRVVMVAAVLAIMLTGKLVYTNRYMYKAENIYHIRQDVIDICELIKPAEGEDNPRAAFPEELTWYVRQYDTHILMPYGADIIEGEAKGMYWDPVYDAMKNAEVTAEGVEIVDAKAIVDATREDGCRYVIMPEDTDKRKLSKDLTTFGLTVVDKVGKFYVYEDPVVVKKLEKKKAAEWN